MEVNIIKKFIVLKKNDKANKIVIMICSIIFFLYYCLYIKTGDQICSIILTGADYKTFTLIFNEYFRLITSAFNHTNLLHYICNMVSLYSLGNYIETLYGTKRYLIYLFFGILFGSLTSGILSTNFIQCGMSAALYTFFIILIMNVIYYKQLVGPTFYPILLLNFGLNLMPSVSWQGHLGGAFAGFILFYIDYFEKNKDTTNTNLFKILLILSTIVLSFKYYQTKNDIELFPGTDIQYAEYLNDLNIPFIKDYYNNKIYNYYVKKESV